MKKTISVHRARGIEVKVIGEEEVVLTPKCLCITYYSPNDMEYRDLYLDVEQSEILLNALREAINTFDSSAKV